MKKTLPQSKEGGRRRKDVGRFLVKKIEHPKKGTTSRSRGESNATPERFEHPVALKKLRTSSANRPSKFLPSTRNKEAEGPVRTSGMVRRPRFGERKGSWKKKKKKTLNFFIAPG